MDEPDDPASPSRPIGMLAGIGLLIEFGVHFGLTYAVLQIWLYSIHRHFDIWSWGGVMGEGGSWGWDFHSLAILSCPSQWSFTTIAFLTAVLLFLDRPQRHGPRPSVVLIKIAIMMIAGVIGLHLFSITAFFPSLESKRGTRTSMIVTWSEILLLTGMIAIAATRSWRRGNWTSRPRT